MLSWHDLIGCQLGKLYIGIILYFTINHINQFSSRVGPMFKEHVVFPTSTFCPHAYVWSCRSKATNLCHSHFMLQWSLESDQSTSPVCHQYPNTFMAGKAVISGVASEWESCPAARRLLLDSGSLLRTAIPGQLCDLSVRGAGMNEDILRPLAKRMKDSTGNMVMVTIPDLVNEKLGWTINLEGFFSTVCLSRTWMIWWYGPMIPSINIYFYTNHHYHTLRIEILCDLLGKSRHKQQIKKDAWVMKKLCVLLKRKIQRANLPRDSGFRALMCTVFPNRFAEPEPEDWHTYMCFIVFFFIPLPSLQCIWLVLISTCWFFLFLFFLSWF